MTVDEIMTDLRTHGSENIKKVLVKHGIKEPFFGVKVEHLKSIQKRVKKDYQLSIGLFATGNADAMYLAGLIADPAKMTKADLQRWAKQALSNNISEYTVPETTVQTPYAYELALEWIESGKEHIAAAGWVTLNRLIALKPGIEPDLPALKSLLTKVTNSLHDSANRVRYTMNGFVIAVGKYVTALKSEAIAAAKKIGKVTVDMGGTACKVPDAIEYIKKGGKE